MWVQDRDVKTETRLRHHHRIRRQLLRKRRLTGLSPLDQDKLRETHAEIDRLERILSRGERVAALKTLLGIRGVYHKLLDMIKSRT